MVILRHQKHEYHVRELIAADMDAVLAIELLAHSHPWPRTHFDSSLHSSHQCTALLLNKALIAYAITSTVVDEAELLNITVSPQYQRQGLGRLLLEYISQSFRATIHTLFLEVRASNVAAITLYDQLGFNEVGQRPRYYPAKGGREDALIMAKMLDSHH